MADRPIRFPFRISPRIHARALAAGALAGALLMAGCQDPFAPAGKPGADARDGLAVALAVVANGTYQLKAVHSGKCLDVAKAGTGDGANIQQWTCGTGSNQKFSLRDIGGGVYEIKAVHSGKCAEVAGRSTANGGNVQQWTCSGGTNQQWRLVDYGSGEYQFKAVHSGKCMDVAGVSKLDGANIQQYTCYNVGQQKFKLVAASSGSTGCTAPDWVAGRNYTAGTVVRYPANGKYYVAEHDNPGYDPVVSTWYWEPTTCGTSGGSGGGDIPSGGTPGTGFAAIVTESLFNKMFPSRNSFYTYSGLVNATASYPSFSNEGDLAIRKREAAAFLANVAHETGNLWYVEEINKGDYCGGGCGCASGKKYYGRGPIQLSWNYNYCAAGAALGLPLQSDPDLVARDAKVAWQTGLWFWMTQSGAGYRPCHQSMVNGNGFGETIRTINGSLECNGGNPGQVQSRIDSYKKFCDLLGVSYGSNVGC